MKLVTKKEQAVVQIQSVEREKMRSVVKMDVTKKEQVVKGVLMKN